MTNLTFKYFRACGPSKWPQMKNESQLLFLVTVRGLCHLHFCTLTAKWPHEEVPLENERLTKHTWVQVVVDNRKKTRDISWNIQVGSFAYRQAVVEWDWEDIHSLSATFCVQKRQCIIHITYCSVWNKLQPVDDTIFFNSADKSLSEFGFTTKGKTQMMKVFKQTFPADLIV